MVSILHKTTIVLCKIDTIIVEKMKKWNSYHCILGIYQHFNQGFLWEIILIVSDFKCCYIIFEDKNWNGSKEKSGAFFATYITLPFSAIERFSLSIRGITFQAIVVCFQRIAI